MRRKKTDKPTLFVIAVLVMFTGGLVFLVASSLAPRTAQEFAASPIGVARVNAGTLVWDTVTIDATAPNWVYFRFSDGSVRTSSDASWDIAAKRFNVVPSGGALDLGAVPFEDVERLPDTGYTASTLGADTSNAVLDDWYNYSWISHLVQPNGHVYSIRTRDGTYARIEFLGYYCTGMVSGCPTFRYVYQGAGGTTVSR